MDDAYQVDIARRFGQELRCRRTQAGMTQRQLADQVKYSREMVAAVERGRRFGSHSLAVRCDEVLGTDGVLTRMWPLVETEQVAADRRRGPRPERASRAEPARLDAARLDAGRLEPAGRLERAGLDGRPVDARPVIKRPESYGEWADWAERIRPTIGEAPPELVDQLRDLINNLVRAGD